jgi:hypothetical protein
MMVRFWPTESFQQVGLMPQRGTREFEEPADEQFDRACMPPVPGIGGGL